MMSQTCRKWFLNTIVEINKILRKINKLGFLRQLDLMNMPIISVIQGITVFKIVSWGGKSDYGQEFRLRTACQRNNKF